eukprot:2029533-Pleurochrysis_carterae.AAC.1
MSGVPWLRAPASPPAPSARAGWKQWGQGPAAEARGGVPRASHSVPRCRCDSLAAAPPLRRPGGPLARVPRLRCLAQCCPASLQDLHNRRLQACLGCPL